MSNIILETERLYIREWDLSDADELLSIMSDYRVHTYTGDTVWTMERVIEYLNYHVSRGKYLLDSFHGAVVMKENNKVIGLAGLNPYLLQQPEIEWQLGAEFWNKGYATELGKAMIEAAFLKTDITKIYGMVNPINIASLKVMQKIGMNALDIRDFRGESCMFFEIVP